MENQQKKFKIVCMSDTHGLNSDINFDLEGDIFIHAGDFTMYGNHKEFDQFCFILSRLKFKHKIVIAGNHEVTLDSLMNPDHFKSFNNKYSHQTRKPAELKEILKKHCTYLEHEYIEIEGIKIFGSPYTVHYHDTAFHYEPHQADHMWNDIPDVDILITHGPPYGIHDFTVKKVNAGSKQLLARVEKMKPKLHIFGHIHEAGGSKMVGDTLYVNVGQCNRDYKIVRKPYSINYYA